MQRGEHLSSMRIGNILLIKESWAIMHEQAHMKFDTNLYLFFKGESILQITKGIEKPWKEH